MSELSRFTALELISAWSTKDVIEILEKNGLDDCCPVMQKRQIDGDELLHLTEGKLALWKRDLSRPNIRNLLTFVETLNRTPQEFIPPSAISHQREEPISDSGSWETDFEDDDEDDNEKRNQQHYNQNENTYVPKRSLNFRDSLLIFQKPEKPIVNLQSSEQQENIAETIYNNCESDCLSENAYMNYKHKDNLPTKKELNTCSLVKKLNLGSSVYREIVHSAVLQNPKEIHSPSVQHLEKNIKSPERSDELPRPPIMLANFDLVANLPTKGDESEDEYEQFDEKIIEQNQKKFASCNSINGSIESFSGSKTDSSADSRDKDEEIYESITETPEDAVYHCLPNLSSAMKEAPPPLPAKPPVPVDVPTSVTTMPKQLNETERSPDKKSSLLEIRATRPLPPPPERQSYMECPWFHNVSREQATALIKERAFNGYFLLRPSSSNPNNPLALVLWFKDRVYNVPVRKRSDNRFALGSPKVNEQTFASVEDIVKFHSREALMLNSGGVQTGSTKLSETPK